MREVRFLLTGLGNIGRSLLEILSVRQEAMATRYGLALRCVGVADSAGAAYDPAGLDIAAVAALKRAGRSVAHLAQYDPTLSAVELAARAEADLLLEATPTNLRDGQPGLEIVRTALRTGKHAVLASKGPLVLAYGELAALASTSDGPALRFSGAVGGALPTANLGRHLAGAVIERAELVVNGTTQVILEQMAAGHGFETALAEAQRQGIVEPDPSLDVDGWDAANKLVIFANAVLGRPTRLTDLRVEGIRGVPPEALRAAWAAGGRVSLVGLAERQPDGGYTLQVGPVTLGPEHPLARLSRGEMGLVVHSDLAGRTTMASLEDGPVGTCQAMIRDIVDIYGAPAAR
ncbi:MAG: homoserine dehydrogenase [Chloroflexales bacterium]|nr:homoserine dehydrogenase [Chloroflexales bacterium]